MTNRARAQDRVMTQHDPHLKLRDAVHLEGDLRAQLSIGDACLGEINDEIWSVGGAEEPPNALKHLLSACDRGRGELEHQHDPWSEQADARLKLLLCKHRHKIKTPIRLLLKRLRRSKRGGRSELSAMNMLNL